MSYVITLVLLVTACPLFGAGHLQNERNVFTKIFRDMRNQHNFKGFNLVVGASMSKDRGIVSMVDAIKHSLIEVSPTNIFDNNDKVNVKKCFRECPHLYQRIINLRASESSPMIYILGSDTTSRSNLQDCVSSSYMLSEKSSVTKVLLIHVTKKRYLTYDGLIYYLYQFDLMHYLLDVDVIEVLIPSKIAKSRKFWRKNSVIKAH